MPSSEALATKHLPLEWRHHSPDGNAVKKTSRGIFNEKTIATASIHTELNSSPIHGKHTKSSEKRDPQVENVSSSCWQKNGKATFKSRRSNVLTDTLTFSELRRRHARQLDTKPPKGTLTQLPANFLSRKSPSSPSATLQ